MPIITIGVASVLSGGLRSIAGWAENAFKDGKISKVEWMQLGSTVLRVGAMTVAITLGAGTGAAQSGGIAVIVDYILMGLKKIGK